MAMTRSRQRLPAGPSKRSRPIRRRVPRTAATWPWGSERLMAMASSPGGTTVPPLSSARTPSTIAAGHSLRLRSVRFLTLPPTRKLSRSRMAGGELRLGTASMYMAHATTHYAKIQAQSSNLHGYIFRAAQRFPAQNQVLDVFQRGKFSLDRVALFCEY